jgi:hypothetical protein
MSDTTEDSLIRDLRTPVQASVSLLVRVGLSRHGVGCTPARGEGPAPFRGESFWRTIAHMQAEWMAGRSHHLPAERIQEHVSHFQSTCPGRRSSMTIFVSYCRKDSTVVKELIRGLESARRGVWVDQALHGGDSWWDTILQAIRQCDVFIFALSDESLKSKPCQAELGYAIALDLPILPVQVGVATGLRTNPVAKLQAVPFSSDDAFSAFTLLAAVDDVARRRKPLPAPLPAPPPIPYAYLLGMEAKLDAEELIPAEQSALVDRLRSALDEEGDDSVRADIRRILEKLRRKQWVTVATARAVSAVLAAAEVTQPDDGAGTEPAEGAVSHGWYPDPAGRHEWRWFDKDWTQWVSDRGSVGEESLR